MIRHVRDTLDWSRKWLVDFNGGKTFFFLFFYQSKNSAAIDVNMGRSILEEKSSFKILGLSFSSKLDWDPYIYLQANWSLDLLYLVSFS